MKTGRKKVLLLALLLVVTAICMVGCSRKKALTAKEFSTKMRDAGYQITDDVGTARYDSVDKIIFASNPHFEVEYYSFDKAASAKTFFNNNMGILVEYYESKNYSHHTSTSTNAQFYSVATATDFVYLSRIKDTCVLVMTDVGYQSEVEEIMKDLGY